MFLQYGAAGAVVPLFSAHLKGLGFTPMQIAWACGAPPLAGMVAPLVVGQVADRWLPAERCLAVCALLAGAALWILSGSTTPSAVFAANFAAWLALGPVITLGTAFSMIHLAAPEKEFGRVRLWGTIGWMVPGWLLGLWFGHGHSDKADSIRLASLLTFALSAYALTLPHTPPRRRASGWLAPVAALRLLRGRAFVVYFVCILGVCVTIPFTSQVTPLLLEHCGVPLSWLPPTLTLGQSMEVASLALLPMLLLRFGVRGTMLLGLGAWATALVILTVGHPVWLVIGSLTLNGLCICCFIVAGQVFVNRKVSGDVRASAQALLTVFNSAGLVTGNLLVGWVRQLVDQDFPSTFTVSAAIALALLVLFGVGFRGAEAA
jgi:MFS family permease